jgi:hypothetical protein
MVRIRRALVDRKRPTEVHLLTIWLPSSPCGEQWVGRSSVKSDRCDVGLALLRELDWGAMRAVMGW